MEIKGVVNLTGLLDGSGDGFFISDAKGKLLYCNPATNPLVGINMVKYKSLDNLLKRNLINRSTAIEAIQKKSVVTGEVKSAAGNSVIATSAPVFNYEGDLECVICNLRDYSSLYRDKKKYYSLNQNRNNRLESAYKILKIKGENDNYELVYCSSVMEEIINLAINLSKVESTVLLQGETGVGKELIAQLIHDRSERKGGPFVKINCASIPANLFESELFGYEPGSFTGALKKGKKGHFELAHKGTLFLDEVAELSLEIQPKLLNVLQDKKIFRVGSTEARPVDVRIIAATNRDLRKMVDEGKFREDLYYRLNVIPVAIPPLRNRIVEIPMFFSYFKNKFQQRYALKNKEFSQELVKYLYWYPWPGNVRELANLVERLLIMSKDNIIKITDLPSQYLHFSEPKEPFTVHEIAPLKEMTRKFEMAVIKKAMEQSKNQKQAAEMLGISFSSLSRKLKE